EARRRRLQQCRSQSAEGRSPGSSPPQLERLFSNVNKATMKHEPGSITGSVFLVAGTTVGAGILAIPAVTQEAGFLASAVTCVFCWTYMVVTGLLVAEVNVNTMCELGSGSVSLVSMAKRTLGTAGVRTLFIFVYTLCTSCCICGTLFRDLNKLTGHTIIGECYPVFTGFWRTMLLRKSASHWCREWFFGVQYHSILHSSCGGGKWKHTVEFSSRNEFCCCSPKYTNNCSFICISECSSCSLHKFGGRPVKSKEGHCIRYCHTPCSVSRMGCCHPGDNPGVCRKWDYY
uniref:Amino acid transporter transmembrane domain-containing protein n=2 Tax=Aegilops tauschii subsp. strangulata TaxID=200361 RepID=A0A453ASI4_AEGTS